MVFAAENENLFSADDTLQQVKNAAIYRARMPALTPSSASRSLVDSDQTGVLSWSPQRVVLSSEETALRKLFSPYKTGGILQRSIDSGHCLNAFPLRAKRLTVRQPEQHRKIRFGRRTVHPRRKQQRPRLLRRVVLLQLKAEKLSKKPRYLDQEKEAAAVSDSLLDTTQQNSGEQENVDAIPPHDHTCNASLDDAKHTENNLVCLPIIDFPLLRIFSVQTGDQYSAEFFRHLRIPKCNQLLIEEWDPVYDPPDGLLCGIPLRAQRHLCRQQLLQGLYNAAGSLNTDCFIASWWFKPATTIPLFEGEHIPNWIPLVESPENLKDAHLLIGCTSSCSRGRLRILSAGLTALYYNVFRFHQETIERISCRAPELASQALIVCGSSATSSFVERLCEIDAGTAGLLLHDFAVNVLVRYPHINWKSAHVIVGSNGVDTHITAHEAFRPGDAHVAALLERLLLKRLQLQVHILTLGAISEALVNTFSEETEVLRSSLAAQSASETRSSDCSELRTDQVDQKNGKADDYSSVVLGTSALVVGAPNAGYRARFTPRSSAMTESWSREPKDGWWPARGQHYDLGLAASAADNLPEHASVLQQETEREAYSKDPSAFLLTRLPRVMNFCNCIQLDLLSYTPRFSAVVSTVESSKAFYARTETLLKRMILGTSGKHQHPLTRSKTRLRVRAGRHCPAELLQFLPKYHLDIVRDTQLLADILKQSRARAQLRGVAGPVVLIKEALNLMYRNLYQWNRPRLKTVEVWIPYLMFRPLASIAHVMKFVAAHKYVRELRVHPLKIPRFLTVYDVFGPKSPEADLLKQLVVNQYFHRDRVAEVEVWGLHQQPMFVFTRPISFRYKIKKWRLRNGYGVKHLPPEVEE